MLIYMLSILGSGLLLRYITTLRYYIKLLDNWIFSTIKAGILYTARVLL